VTGRVELSGQRVYRPAIQAGMDFGNVGELQYNLQPSVVEIRFLCQQPLVLINSKPPDAYTKMKLFKLDNLRFSFVLRACSGA